MGAARALTLRRDLAQNIEVMDPPRGMQARGFLVESIEMRNICVADLKPGVFLARGMRWSVFESDTWPVTCTVLVEHVPSILRSRCRGATAVARHTLPPHTLRVARDAGRLPQSCS